MINPNHINTIAEGYELQLKNLREQLDEAMQLLETFRDDVVFKIGSTSPYRQVVQAFQDRIAAMSGSNQ